MGQCDLRLHGSCIAHQGRGLMILGASGAGKSALALELMAYGADLIADDQTELFLRDNWPMARAPDGLHGKIEARGLGILEVAAKDTARVVAVIDLDQVETGRCPQDRYIALLGQEIPLFHKIESRHFGAGLWVYLKGGKAMI